METTGAFPQLETERLVLRMLTRDDAETIFPHFSTDEVARYIDYEPAKSVEDVEGIIDWGQNLIKNNAGVLWGIFKREDGSFLGQVNYVIRKDANWTGDAHRAELGYELTPVYWGNGYVSEALRSVVPHVFSTSTINRVEALVHSQNQRSLRVLERLGFRKEGVLREYVLWHGELWDMVLYSMLKSDRVL
jgi:ribosomal-protein-alanine N-acetyltransferase